MAKRQLKRKALKVHPTIINQFKEVTRAFEGVGDFANETEKDIKQLKQANIIFNVVLDILIEKGIITQNEIKTKLQQKSGITTVEEGGPPTESTDKSDNPE